MSFYFFISKKYARSIVFFVFALLSKETAILFMPFLILFVFLYNKEKAAAKIKLITPFLLVSTAAYLIYQYGLNSVTQLENYQTHTDLKFIINNGMWYLLWGIGFPNFLPDFVISIFRPPLPDFWKVLALPDVRNYFVAFSSYLFIFSLSLTYLVIKNKERKMIILFGVLSLFCFFIFLGPILTVFHKWMVRLTLPLIFLSLFQAYIIYLLLKEKSVFKYLSFVLIVLYLMTNLLGTIVHESSSTFTLESRIVDKAEKYFLENREEILKYDHIYFVDKSQRRKVIKVSPFWGSEKLKVTFHDQDFIDYFFPHSGITAVYEFENKTIPENSYIIYSLDILEP